jgi:hypothetical protein
MTKLDQLHLEKSGKLAEICALVARELEYGVRDDKIGSALSRRT